MNHHDPTRHRLYPGWGKQSAGSGYFEGRGTVVASAEEDRGRLDGQAMLLLAVNALFTIGNSLSGTFVGVYLWKAKHDFALIGWFTLVTFLTMALTFWVAGKWVKEHNKMNCLRIGVAVSAVFYLLVLWLGTTSVHYIVPLGMVQGISTGLFWLAFNVVYFEVTDPDSRDRFNGWVGLLSSIAGMVAPWVSGGLIVRLGGVNGYRLIFSLSLGIFVLGVVVSFFLKKRKAEGSYEWLLAVRCLKRKDTPWRRVFAALAAQGVREGVFGFMIGLLVYLATQSEGRLGNFTLVTSSVGLVSYWAVGRYIKPRFRLWAMLVGAGLMVAVIVPFFWQVSYVTLLIFGVTVALVFPLYTIPMVSAVFDLIGSDAESARQREEYVVLRELGLNAGRVVGALLFIAVVSWSTQPKVISTLMLVIGSSPLVSWLFIRKQLKAAHRA
ncbi:MFS transporter [Paenibacillus athensensis]|uniref:MFS transporter n=1 Tax=Paenibacillus athensensis TaxID=1967502 RepID=A0A4Y8PXX2_9BACL|nr:MFS transporter [Paenibacillus athensensis]MCD1259309.1 MFS transporter [Paenibacillus athensensis]